MGGINEDMREEGEGGCGHRVGECSVLYRDPRSGSGKKRLKQREGEDCWRRRNCEVILSGGGYRVRCERGCWQDEK